MANACIPDCGQDALDTSPLFVCLTACCCCCSTQRAATLVRKEFSYASLPLRPSTFGSGCRSRVTESFTALAHCAAGAIIRASADLHGSQAAQDGRMGAGQGCTMHPPSPCLDFEPRAAPRAGERRAVRTDQVPQEDSRVDHADRRLGDKGAEVGLQLLLVGTGLRVQHLPIPDGVEAGRRAHLCVCVGGGGEGRAGTRHAGPLQHTRGPWLLPCSTRVESSEPTAKTNARGPQGGGGRARVAGRTSGCTATLQAAVRKSKHRCR